MPKNEEKQQNGRSLDQRIQALEDALALNDVKSVMDTLNEIKTRLSPFQKAAAILRDIVVPVAMAAMSTYLAWFTWRETEQKKTAAETKLEALEKTFKDAARELETMKAAIDVATDALVQKRSSEYHNLFQQALAPATPMDARIAALAGICVQDVDIPLATSAKIALLSLRHTCQARCKDKVQDKVEDRVCNDACHQLRCLIGVKDEGDGDCGIVHAVCKQ